MPAVGSWPLATGYLEKKPNSSLAIKPQIKPAFFNHFHGHGNLIIRYIIGGFIIAMNPDAVYLYVIVAGILKYINGKNTSATAMPVIICLVFLKFIISSSWF